MMDDLNAQPTDLDLPVGDLGTETPDAPSMDDEMLAIVKGIDAREKGEEPPTVEEVAAQRARDEGGRFVKGEAKPAEPAQQAKPGEFQDRGAPTTWRPAAKARWNDFAKQFPDVAGEVYKREQDTLNGIQQYQGKAQVADALMGAIQPYRPIIDALGTDIPGALNEVLKTAAIFHVGTQEQKVATLRALAQRHGVDIGTVNNGPTDQFHDPVIDELRGQLRQVQGELAGYRQASQNSEWQVAAGEINAFRSDQANKYFNDVAVQMGQLINAGLAASMKDAYDKACQLNPQVKAALEMERGQAALSERAKQAAAARRAGDLGVRSSPTPRPVASPGKSMWDAMEDYHAQIVARDAA